MPLYDGYKRDGIPQAALLGGDHWKLFERFEGAPLHRAFVEHVRSYLDQEVLYSRQIGHQILERIRADSPQLLEPYDYETAGGLFGMTLWNLLAKHSESWYWVRDDSREGDRASIYFRLRGK